MSSKRQDRKRSRHCKIHRAHGPAEASCSLFETWGECAPRRIKWMGACSNRRDRPLRFGGVPDNIYVRDRKKRNGRLEPSVPWPAPSRQRKERPFLPRILPQRTREPLWPYVVSTVSTLARMARLIGTGFRPPKFTSKVMRNVSRLTQTPRTFIHLKPSMPYSSRRLFRQLSLSRKRAAKNAGA